MKYITIILFLAIAAALPLGPPPTPHARSIEKRVPKGRGGGGLSSTKTAEKPDKPDKPASDKDKDKDKDKKTDPKKEANKPPPAPPPPTIQLGPRPPTYYGVPGQPTTGQYAGGTVYRLPWMAHPQPGYYPPSQYPPPQYPPSHYPPSQYPPSQYQPSQYPPSAPGAPYGTQAIPPGPGQGGQYTTGNGDQTPPPGYSNGQQGAQPPPGQGQAASQTIDQSGPMGAQTPPSPARDQGAPPPPLDDVATISPSKG